MRMHQLALIIASITMAAALAGAEPPAQTKYLIPSWGDVTLVHGPGTDPAMDSEQGMENIFRHWKGRGFTGAFLRTDLIHAPPGSLVRSAEKKRDNPRHAILLHIIDEIVERCDPHLAARKAAEKTGFEYWAFHPHIYSEGAPPEIGEPGVGRLGPWSYARKYHVEHPEVITIDRRGNRQWMVPEYAYPGARADKVADFVYLARTYRPTGIVASMRSEASQLLDPPEHGDQYGFNQPIVDEMKRLYNVDILTDPRFDYKSSSFKSDDPMVENWRVLRGTYVTQLYREIREALRQVDPKIQFAVTLSGDYVGPVLGNWKLDWRTWVDEGIVDVILVPVTFEATQDLEADRKGYLTNTRAGVGMVAATEISDYIARSKHPNIRVIHTGAPSYFYPPAPEGADGWQCDAWYDLYTVAWYQRWQQWKQDLAEFGHIKFFDQNFDEFPVRGTGKSGGWGDGRHDPQRRSTPGLWYRIGDGSDDRAIVQHDVRCGDSGAAIQLGREPFVGLHMAVPDRSRMSSMLDNTISNGNATLEFSVHRETEQVGLTVLFTGDIINTSYTMTDDDKKDVGLRLEPGTGRISFRSGQEWIESEVTLPTKQWQRLTMKINADDQTYSAFAGTEEALICRDVRYAPASDRFVEQHGVNVPIKVPAYRVFNTLNFIPDAGERGRIYLDDVTVKWVPTLHYAPAGETIVVNETFEAAEPGAPVSRASDGAWLVEPAERAESFLIENTTSFGPGVKCARAAGGGELTREVSTSPDGVATLDLDFFIRTDRDFPYMLPDPTTRSPHGAVVSIEDASGEILAAADSANGTWRVWDGTQFVDTGKLVAYDVWNHAQIAIDPQSKTYRLIVQPIGELPSVIGEAAIGSAGSNDQNLILKIKPSATDGHISCYDNVVLTAH